MNYMLFIVIYSFEGAVKFIKISKNKIINYREHRGYRAKITTLCVLCVSEANLFRSNRDTEAQRTLLSSKANTILSSYLTLKDTAETFEHKSVRCV